MAQSGTIEIRFAARTDEAKRSIASLSASVASNMSTLSAGLIAANASADGLIGRLERMGPAGETAADGFRAFQTVKATLEGVKVALSEVNKALQDPTGGFEKLIGIASQARTAGVGTSFFQAYTQQAREMGVEVKTLTDILNKAREAATVRIGEGTDATNASAFGNSLTQNVRAGNLSQSDRAAYDAADTQEGRIRAALDLIETLRDRGKELASLDLARTMFGADFEQQLRNGVDAIGKMRSALEGMDVAGGARVISPEEIARAERIQAKLTEIENTMAAGLKPILEDITYVQQRGYEAWVDWQVKVAQIVGTIGDMYLKVKEVVGEVRTLAESWGLITPQMQGPPAPAENEGGLVVNVRPRRRPDTSRPLPSLRRSSGGSEEVDKVEDLIRALEKAKGIAEAELRTVGLTNVEREKAVALARAEAAAREDMDKGRRTSATLTDDEVRRVLAAAEAQAKLKDATRDAQQALAQQAETMRYFGNQASDALGKMIFDGASAKDVMNDLMKTIGKAGLQSLLTGQGPLAGLLGSAPAASAGPNAVGGLLGLFQSLTSGFRAGGGPVGAGQAYTVGEAGREVFIPGQDGRVYPIGNASGASSAAPNVNVHNYGGGPSEVQTRKRADGGWDVDAVVRGVEARIAGRGSIGQGALAPMMNTPGRRKG